jgi:hypothetical protein
MTYGGNNIKSKKQNDMLLKQEGEQKMGAFIYVREGTSASEVLDELTQEAEFENGHNGYNGTISTCSFFGCKRKFDEYTKENEKKMLAFAREEIANVGTRDCYCIDLGLVGYIQTDIKKKVEKVTAKYVSKFVVCDAITYTAISNNSYRDTKKEADELAAKYALDGKEVIVRKMPVKISGNEVCTKFETSQKRVKKNSPTTATRKTVPVHKYIFYGFGKD